MGRFFGKIAVMLFLLPGLALLLGQQGVRAAEDMENVGELRLVYGDESLADSKAFVLLILAEGFTEGEQEKFYEGAKRMALHLVSSSPYDEFADVTKIYALGTVSAQSGAKGDRAKSAAEAEADARDTFFDTTFWYGGRKLHIYFSQESYDKMCRVVREAQMRDSLSLHEDYIAILVNSEQSRGTTTIFGRYGFVTLDERTLPHELAHMVAGLADEYDEPNHLSAAEAANRTQEADPEKVPWARYIGAGDIGVYEYKYVDGWYHPSMNCRMRSQRAAGFCEVCKDELRKSILRYCTATKLFFQTYGDQLTASGEGTDLRGYFTVRKGYRELEGSEIPEELLQLTCYDSQGRALDGLPGKVGTYTVEARFLGDGTFEPCALTVSCEIKNNSVNVFWLAVTPLLIGAFATAGYFLARRGRKARAKRRGSAADQQA